jgi:phage shock protein A
MMRREAAEQRIRVRSQVYDGRVDDALARYNTIERKVDEMEAYADTIKGREPTLEAEFAALERNESVEKELEALKAKRSKSSSKSTKSEA